MLHVSKESVDIKFSHIMSAISNVSIEFGQLSHLVFRVITLCVSGAMTQISVLTTNIDDAISRDTLSLAVFLTPSYVSFARLSFFERLSTTAFSRNANRQRARCTPINFFNL